MANEELKAEIEALKAAKARLIKAHEGMLAANRLKRRQARELARKLTEGHESTKAYSTWTRDQFGPRPPHMVAAGKKGRGTG